jgi:hypothetical protein
MKPRFNMTGDWGLLANMGEGRPSETASIEAVSQSAAAARDLAATGLTARDIGPTLGITEHAVSQLLRDSVASPSQGNRNV